MKTKQITVCALLALISVLANASGQGWPPLISGKDRPECMAALELARDAYESSAALLFYFEPEDSSQDLDNTLVLAADTSGSVTQNFVDGSDIDKSEGLFDRIDNAGEEKSYTLYWQREPYSGSRLVLTELDYRWGTKTSARFITPNMTIDQFGLDYLSSTHLNPGEMGTYNLKVYRSNKLNQLWLIDGGDEFNNSTTWRVYIPFENKPQEVCEIGLFPEIDPTSMLPSAVRRLAILMARSIGSGRGERHHGPTVYIRFRTLNNWANAAMRPWAELEPYNSREEVDAGLAEWAQRGKAYRAAYAEIQTQYKIAETALANYYKRRFKMPLIDARATAERVLDGVFREQYVFHSTFNRERAEKLYRQETWSAVAPPQGPTPFMFLAPLPK